MNNCSTLSDVETRCVASPADRWTSRLNGQRRDASRLYDSFVKSFLNSFQDTNQILNLLLHVQHHRSRPQPLRACRKSNISALLF